MLQALHLWRSIIGPDTPEPSETGSSIKGYKTDTLFVYLSRKLAAQVEYTGFSESNFITFYIMVCQSS